METIKRSICKTISWRIVATIITATIVYILTGRFEFAAAIGLLDTTVKFIAYFFHERIWNKIGFGRK